MGLTFGREAVFRAKWSNKASELQNQLFEGKIVGGGGGGRERADKPMFWVEGGSPSSPYTKGNLG